MSEARTYTEQELAELMPPGGHTEQIGMRITEASGRRVVARLDADERHHQPWGVVHGGVYCSMVESVASIGGWLAVREEGKIVVGVANQTDFFRKHETGRLDLLAESIHQGRSQQLWSAEIRRASDGKLVARGQVRLAHLDA
ncbi:MAG: PaaI family thioesterase [Egibacteraceae bacterium]